ncbi:MAG: hypothetical protein IIB00_00025 [candidate division Zixibacteria bacterium]|nr:hypothetical protein [candidate division Zixibacteria bacterium]
MNARALRWGILFITIGALWLLVSADILDGAVFLELLAWWPVFLIAIGIEMIFKRTPIKALAYLSPALVAGVVAIVVFQFYLWDGGSRNSETSRIRENVSPSVELLRATLDIGENDLTLRGRAGEVISARYYGFAQKPVSSYSEKDNQATFDFTSGSGFFGSRRGGPIPGIYIDYDRRDDGYKIQFPNRTKLELELTGEDSRADLNLMDIPLMVFSGDLNGVSLKLRIGDKESEVSVSLKGPSNRLTLEVPAGSGIQVDGESYGRYLTRKGLLEKDGFYESPGFDTLSPKIRIRLLDELAGLSIRFY